MSVEIVKKFNEILGSFLVQITPLVGGKYHKKFTMATKFNSSLAIERFLVHALPVRDKILERDETYFTNNDYSNEVENDEETLNEIVNMKDIYTKLDKESIDNVWDIFQALLVLGEDYIRIKKC